MRITLATMHAGEAVSAYGRHTAAQKRDYCERHGYGFMEVTERIDTERPHSWSKLPIIRACFDSGAEFVFWSDADAVIAKPDQRLERFLHEMDGYDFIVSGDHNDINLSHFFVRNTPFANGILSDLPNHEVPGHPWWEQIAFINRIKIGIDLSSKTFLAGMAFSACWFQQPSLALHVGGINQGIRLRVLLAALDHLSKNRSLAGFVPMKNLDRFLLPDDAARTPLSHIQALRNAANRRRLK